MASSKEYLHFVLDQLSALEEITVRAMMGEYILYYRGKIFGGIYDNRLLVKDVPSAAARLPDAPREIPYEGARVMLSVTELDDRAFLQELIRSMEPELVLPKKRPSRRGS